MLRASLLAVIVAASPSLAMAQAPGVLHISVTLVDASQRTLQVPRHALLISDNPPSASPRRVMTGPDGTVDVRLTAGTYTVESDRPVALAGKAYQWTQTVVIASGQNLSLMLTAANADADVASVDATTLATADTDTDPKLLALRWKDSVVGIWSPTARATGFLAASAGLILTNERSVGSATTVEVQLSATVKVQGRVLAADRTRDVAVVLANPLALDAVRPMDAGCAAGAAPALAEGTDIVALTLAADRTATVVPGSLSRADAKAIVTDLIFDEGGTGGPAFTTDGRFAGLTSTYDTDDQRTRGHVALAGADGACAMLATAEQSLTSSDVPPSTHLPVEPPRAFPVALLDEAVRARTGNLNAYTMRSADFDVAFITPVQVHAALGRGNQAGGGTSRQGAPRADTLVNPLDDFANWTSYVSSLPPVLLIRATPRLTESVWATIGRGAAMTQGVNLPAMKHAKPGFARMVVRCGASEVAPIHAFTIVQRLSESDVIDEGLYAFDPAALGPHCGPLSLEFFSQKEPAKGNRQVVDSKLVEQFWRDFESYRAQP